MENNPQALTKKEPVSVEFIPYGAQDKIKLSVQIVQNLIAVKTKSGKTCSEREAIKFLAMCQAKRMNPFEGDCFLIGYDSRDGASFALVTAHQTYLKRAELHPEFDGMKSGIIVSEDGQLKDLEGDFYADGQRVVGGWATVFFKTRKNPMHKRLRLARFQKSFGVWQEDPGGMICKCAEADALRSSFPTMLGGLYLREEIEIEPKKEVLRPMFSSTPSAGTLPEAGPEPENGHAEPSGEPEPTPEPGAAAEAAGKRLGSLRSLLKAGSIGEGALLDYLSTVGTTEGDAPTLEDLAAGYPEVCDQLIANFATVAKAIKGAK